MFDTIAAIGTTHGSETERLDALVMGERALRLDVLAELVGLDDAEAWRHDGATSMTDWLVGRYSVAVGTAREWMKVADALEDLPHIRAAYADGKLSWDQLRALVRFATPDNEAEWADQAPDMTVVELRAVDKTVENVDVVEAHEQRRVRWWFHNDRPGFHMTVDMADVEGATLATWLTRRAGQCNPDPHSGIYEPFEARCADALSELASQALAADGDHDRATVLIHTDLATLMHGTGTATITNGPPLASDTLRRLACDARIQLALTDPEVGTIGVGRTARTVPPWLARLVRSRDHHCRFPGCRRTRWTHAHHIEHWAHGGPTDLDNLLTLCGHHHRLIHEHGWTITGNPAGPITWHRPDGRRFQPQAPRHPLEIWKKALSLSPPVLPPTRPAVVAPLLS